MRDRISWLAILFLALAPLVAGSSDESLRALAERLGGSVFPTEADQPVTQLNLGNTGVADDDLSILAGKTELQVLYLRGTSISDSGLLHLKSVTGLYQLNLSGTKITDAGLPNLAGMKNLAGLQLADTAISDNGLESLRGFTTLRSLDLKRTETTANAIESLRALLPIVRIQSDAGLVTGGGVAAEIAAAQEAIRHLMPKPTTPPLAPPCTDLSDVNCLKEELSSGVRKRCIAATNAIAEVRNERAQLGGIGADQELVEATASFLLDLAHNEGNPCQDSGFTGLDWLGPGIRRVLPADEVVPFLIATIGAGRAAGRFGTRHDSALRILPSFGTDGAEAVPMLIDIVADENSPVTRSKRTDAIKALAAIGPKALAAEAILFATMADDEATDDYRVLETRAKSAEALLAIGAAPERVAEALVPWLVEEERILRTTSRRLLIEIGEPAATAVASGLSSPDQKTMGAAVDVLTAMGPDARVVIPEAVAAVIATGDPNGYLEMLLTEIGPGGADSVAALAASLDTGNEGLQARAAAILGQWGSAASAALPALRRLAASDSSASFIAEMAIEEFQTGNDN